MQLDIRRVSLQVLPTAVGVKVTSVQRCRGGNRNSGKEDTVCVVLVRLKVIVRNPNA